MRRRSTRFVERTVFAALLLAGVDGFAALESREEVLRSIFSSSALWEVPADAVGETEVWRVQLKADLYGTLRIPDNLGELELDLCGHVIEGLAGVEGADSSSGGDGGAGLEIVSSGADWGTATELLVITTRGEARIAGGAGGMGNPGGRGGDGVRVDQDCRCWAMVSVGRNVEVCGGDGGKGFGFGEITEPEEGRSLVMKGARGGNGGDAISGDVDTVESCRGGNGGEGADLPTGTKGQTGDGGDGGCGDGGDYYDEDDDCVGEGGKCGGYLGDENDDGWDFGCYGNYGLTLREVELRRVFPAEQHWDIGFDYYGSGVDQITLYEMIEGTVRIPDNLGPIIIDLNGLEIRGDEGMPAVEIYASGHRGEETELGFVNFDTEKVSRIIGGAGRSGSNPGAGGAGVSVDMDVREGVAVSFVTAASEDDDDIDADFFGLIEVHGGAGGDGVGVVAQGDGAAGAAGGVGVIGPSGVVVGNDMSIFGGDGGKGGDATTGKPGVGGEGGLAVDPEYPIEGTGWAVAGKRGADGRDGDASLVGCAPEDFKIEIVMCSAGLSLRIDPDLRGTLIGGLRHRYEILGKVRLSDPDWQSSELPDVRGAIEMGDEFFKTNRFFKVRVSWAEALSRIER